MGAGLAFAHKYRKDGSVSFTIYGDGAANQGAIPFHSYLQSPRACLPANTCILPSCFLLLFV